MRRIPFEHLVPGMVVAREIVDLNGATLLGKGVRLTPRYIARLKEIGISAVDIEDDFLSDIEIKDIISNKTRNMAMKAINEIITNSKTGTAFKTENVKNAVKAIMDELLSDPNAMIGLSDIRTSDNYTFAHSVNVCVFSLMTGINLQFNKNDLYDLGMGALLHDIGKVMVNSSVRDKPGILTLEEKKQMELHTFYGFEMIRKQLKLSSVIAHIAYQHHERYDGTGYPRQLKGEDIHLFGRIVAIADTYDAITSDRIYRKKFYPHQAAEYILAMGNTMFDFEIAKEFIKKISIFPVGTPVILTNGYKGYVIKINKENPTRPVIRLKYDKEMNILSKPIEIDLSKDVNVLILKVDEEDFVPQKYSVNL